MLNTQLEMYQRCYDNISAVNGNSLIMNEVQKIINEAFEYMRAIPVTGDSVELMAAAKEAMRRAYAMSADAEDKAETKDA